MVRLLTPRQPASAEKQKIILKQPADRNPFLPYDPDLFVTNLSPSHVCLLNKFNVTEHHLLIVTRTFEEQDQLLTLADFVAVWRCLLEIDGLAFYNGGVQAGASQPHKHLQLAPFPFAEESYSPPIESVIAKSSGRPIGRSPALPFVHGISWLPAELCGDEQQAANISHALYHTLLANVGLPVGAAGRSQQPGPYNLLMTRQWMFLVPRSQDGAEGISINSLGFAGSLFARNPEQLHYIKSLGPLNILRAVAIPR
jgi:ATP adenylyltransferase